MENQAQPEEPKEDQQREQRVTGELWIVLGVAAVLAVFYYRAFWMEVGVATIAMVQDIKGLSMFGLAFAAMCGAHWLLIRLRKNGVTGILKEQRETVKKNSHAIRYVGCYAIFAVVFVAIPQVYQRQSEKLSDLTEKYAAKIRITFKQITTFRDSDTGQFAQLVWLGARQKKLPLHVNRA